MSRITTMQKYEYKNMEIGGGGFVTGLLFHPTDSSKLYARTDVGGTYRYDFQKQEWYSLNDDVTAEDTSETYPLGIAIDPDDSEKLFVTSGNREHSWLSYSQNGGNTFEKKRLPFFVHGNEPGRGTGERLHYYKGKIIFGSMHDGIVFSDDMGESFYSCDVNGELNCSLIWINRDENGLNSQDEFVLVGVSGENCSKDGKTRGCTFYATYDNLKSFEAVTIPQPEILENATYYGFVPQRITNDDKYIYVTFSASGKVVFGGWSAYTCDAGGVFDGRVFRYKVDNGKVQFDRDITPQKFGSEHSHGGYSGISSVDGVLLCATISRSGGDVIYRSTDCGEHWEMIMKGLEIGEFDWNISYMKPCYNGGGNCIHWMTDLEISPHNPNFAVVNSGTGIFRLDNIKGDKVRISAFSKGVEETVHLNVYSIPSGRTKVLDIIGDLGGFAFEDYDKPCENSFADENNNRYITCLNGDFPLNNPDRVVCTPRGNWTGKTKGGVILSEDQCRSWKLLPQPKGLTAEIDTKLDEIAKPNVDSGWVAISADGKRILWSLGREFSSHMTVYTDNDGESWDKSIFLEKDGTVTEKSETVQVFSDYFDENLFFAVAKDFSIFVSRDKGRTFTRQLSDTGLFKSVFREHQIFRQPDVSGVFWIADGHTGLYRFEICENSFEFKNILLNDEYARCISFGKGKGDIPAMYITGKINGIYGFYRSDNLGEDFVRINDNAHSFGHIIAIAGDLREYDGFFLATGSKGLIHGKISK